MFEKVESHFVGPFPVCFRLLSQMVFQLIRHYVSERVLLNLSARVELFHQFAEILLRIWSSLHFQAAISVPFPCERTILLIDPWNIILLISFQV